MGLGEYVQEGVMLPGRPRPHYTYSRKSNFKKNKGTGFGFDTDNEDDDANLKSVSPQCFWYSKYFSTFFLLEVGVLVQTKHQYIRHFRDD